LLQAVARTNRVEGPGKQHGLVVDYVGVTAKLSEALASYRSEDVRNAMNNLESLRTELKQAHADVVGQMKTLKRRKARQSREEYAAEFTALIHALETVERWRDFKARARRFIRLYEALSPDPAVLEYKRDLKWITMFLAYASHHFEQEEFVDIGNCSAKIREILEEELTAAGLRDVVAVRSLADKEFWDDFAADGKTEAQLAAAAMRKATELKQTIAERLDQNREQYLPFSIR
ncbi:MAG: restriction endonuclease subunit R, partial [Desulfobacterales bacterium]|nr:restriction endonuclease subunit R [Desulfobacterales bacterium]